MMRAAESARRAHFVPAVRRGRSAALARVAAIILAMAMILLACTACGPAFTDDDKAAFSGSWELVSMGPEGEDQQLTNGDVLLYKEWGLTSELVLAEDDTCVLTFYGDQVQGTWKMESAAEASVELTVRNEEKLQLETYPLVLADGLLTMQVPDLPVIFQKKPPAADGDGEEE